MLKGEAETSTDGIVVVNRGQIVFERYANGMTVTTPHILMSVSKSLLGLVAGGLAASGRLEPNRKVTDFVPEVGGTAYQGASLASRHHPRRDGGVVKVIRYPAQRFCRFARKSAACSGALSTRVRADHRA
jgi:beta-lactamase family protein